MSYKCESCNVTFTRKNTLDRHYNSILHKKKQNDEIKMYPCICGKKYSYHQSLHMHRKSCEQWKNRKKIIDTPLKSNIDNQPDVTETIEDIQEENKALNEKNKSLQQEKIKSLQEKNKALQEENTQLKRQLKGIKRVTPSMRQMIANNQERKCGQCSNDLQTYFQVDHIIGKQFGGDNSLENLMALCGECHNQKSALENIKREQIKQAIQNILQEPTPMSLSV